VVREPSREIRADAPQVLVAHPDRDTLELIDLKLKAEGFRVVGASNGTDAFGLALELKPRLILLDVLVGGIDAHEVCRRLRADWRFANTGIVLLGSQQVPRRVASSLALGADDYIVQPFDAAELVARVASTLRRLDEMRSASPLTGLPGNVQIERELQRRCSAGERLALVYVDLDHFKAFNDHYGFLRGDQVIAALGEILREAAEKQPNTFLGHVGGDDFIVLVDPSRVRHLVREVMSSFAVRVQELYDSRDAARGWIELEDRQGKRRRYGLLTLSMGVATNLDRRIDHRRLVDIATELKQYAKRRTGNVVAVDRRSGRTLTSLRQERVGSGREETNREPDVRGSARRNRLAPESIEVALRRRFRPRAIGVLFVRLLARPALALVLLLLLTGPMVAENAQPGETLWPVKLRLETLRLAVERDPADDVRLHLEFVSRRLAELGTLIHEVPEESLVASVASNLRDNVVSAVRVLEAVEEQSPGLAEGLRAQLGPSLVQQANELALLLGSCGGGQLVRANCGALRNAMSSLSWAVGRAAPGMQDHLRVPGRPFTVRDERDHDGADHRRSKPPPSGDSQNGDGAGPGKGKGKRGGDDRAQGGQGTGQGQGGQGTGGQGQGQGGQGKGGQGQGQGGQGQEVAGGKGRQDRS
jgi:diguanylate cyclase (GGDEF)-like protein